MQDKAQVHVAKGKQRIARGIRMPRELWEFVDAHATVVGDENGGRLIERWVRERREAVQLLDGEEDLLGLLLRERRKVGA